MTNEKELTLHEKALNDIEEAAHRLESRLQHGGETEKNIQEFQQRKRERKASEGEKNWMQELDRLTFSILTVEIVLVTYLILGLAGYVPLF